MQTPLLALTAADLISRPIVAVSPDLSLREAAHVLIRNRISGLPIVDKDGQCIGVLSATDLLRATEGPGGAIRLPSHPLPITCCFQEKHWGPPGGGVRCTLPSGICPLQVQREGADGQRVLVCSDPCCVLADWQVVQSGDTPADEVRHYMTAGPVTVPATTPIRELSRLMVDAHMHRVIVVDEERRPVGVVSSTDVLAAVAYADGNAGEEKHPER
jgi:CBS domain-containing protein